MDYRVLLGAREVAGSIYVPATIGLDKGQCHTLICGSSGSGKSVQVLYALNSVLNTNIELYIADFKGSGDFVGISDKYAEYDAIFDLIVDFYDEYQRIKEKKLNKKLLLVADEYAGAIIYLEGQDKARAKTIKSMIAEILMQGRELAGGGGAWIWTICQRADASYFNNGARDNYQVRVLFGKPSTESRQMMGFDKEDIPEDYAPARGRALCCIEGQELFVLQVPKIDKNRLKALLRKKASRRAGEASL